MKEILKVTLAQQNIVWENPAQNLINLDSLLSGLEETDIIFLPEMFTTGFTMNPSCFAEPMDGGTVDWMKTKAAALNAAIAGSLIIFEDGEYKNRCLWVNPDGCVSYYDKRHLFSLGGENQHYTPGKEKLIVEYKGWRICPLICYDLRFPVWSRNAENYDILVYMANWPSARHHVWKTLLAARAIENQCYCFGVNRTGTDGAGLRYLGDSGLCDPKGFPVFTGESEQIKSFEVLRSELAGFREKFPLLPDRDHFTIHQ